MTIRFNGRWIMHVIYHYSTTSTREEDEKAYNDAMDAVNVALFNGYELKQVIRHGSDIDFFLVREEQK